MDYSGGSRHRWHHLVCEQFVNTSFGNADDKHPNDYDYNEHHNYGYAVWYF